MWLILTEICDSTAIQREKGSIFFWQANIIKSSTSYSGFGRDYVAWPQYFPGKGNENGKRARWRKSFGDNRQARITLGITCDPVFRVCKIHGVSRRFLYLNLEMKRVDGFMWESKQSCGRIDRMFLDNWFESIEECSIDLNEFARISFDWRLIWKVGIKEYSINVQTRI